MIQIHIMLDLETWGTRAGCDIRSIGATVFNPYTGKVSIPNDGDTFYIATSNPALWPQLENEAHCERKYNLLRDPDTVFWWSEQSPEAQAAFADPVDFRLGLREFATWLIDLTRTDRHSIVMADYDYAPDFYKPELNLRLWAHGPQFDCSILEAAFHAVQLPVPWHYRAPRDTRTIFDAAGIEDHSAHMAQYNTGTHHHALDDAICQAKAVCAAYDMIKS